MEDLRPFLAAARRSASLHGPWVTPPLSAAQFRAWLARMQPPNNYALLVCRIDTNEIVGVINLSNIVRGLFQSGYIGLAQGDEEYHVMFPGVVAGRLI